MCTLQSTFSSVLQYFKNTLLFRCHCLPLILGDLIVTNSKAKFIITHKLLLTHYSFECTVARNVVGYLASFPQTHFLYEVTRDITVVYLQVTDNFFRNKSFLRRLYLVKAPPSSPNPIPNLNSNNLGFGEGKALSCFGSCSI